MADLQDKLAALAWLVEAGADEAIGDAVVNRFAVRPRPEPVAAKAEVPRARPAPPRPTAEAAAPSDHIGTALELAAGAQSLDQLRSTVESFDFGALKRSATKMVFADGNPESRIMLIGEAPGRDEDRAGLPFIGRAGKLLDKMLLSIGLDRTNAYITNVLNWRPPDNRDPSPEEAALALPFLRRHIELVDPLVIVLLGAVSVRHVLGRSDGIMKTRGQWFEYRVQDRMAPVMPTLHPAYLLRQPAHKRLAWRDLQAIEKKIAESRKPA